ncbi:MAG: LPXTG cell wall anchor domain-containing protein [Blautia sp.]
MKKKSKGRKLFSVIAVLCLALVQFSSVVMAADTEKKDGLEVTLSTTKDSYKTNEDIPITLTIKNNTDKTISNIQPEFLLPSGLSVVKGKTKPAAITLEAGKSQTMTLTAKKAVKTAAAKTNTTKTTATKTKTAAKTGDETPIFLWSALLLFSVVLVIVLVKKKKINRNIFLGLLCLLLAGTLPAPVSVKAATNTKSVSASKEITVGGTKVKLQAKVTYTYKETETVTVNKYTVNVLKGTGDGTYEAGKTVTIKADTPEEGRYFRKWNVIKGSITLKDNTKETTTFTMPKEDVELEAVYEINSYTIKASAGTGGTITPSGDVLVKYGSSAEFIITPDEGYHVKSVMADDKKVSLTEGKYVFKDVKEPHTISAEFEKDITAVTITASAGEGGTITPSGEIQAEIGTSVEFTITPEEGYHVKSVLVDDAVVSLTDDKYVFADVKESHTISAFFEEDVTAVTITASAGEGGTITPSGEIQAEIGTSVEFTITPEEGYHVKSVLVDDTVVSLTDNKYVLTDVKESHTISASFEKDVYTVNDPTKQEEESPKQDTEISKQDAEAAKITGIKKQDTASQDTLSFQLVGYDKLEKDTKVTLVKILAGAKAPGTPVDLGASLEKGILTLNKEKTDKAANLTYVGLVYKVTLMDGSKSDEKTLDISSVFKKDATDKATAPAAVTAAK